MKWYVYFYCIDFSHSVSNSLIISWVPILTKKVLLIHSVMVGSHNTFVFLFIKSIRNKWISSSCKISLVLSFEPKLPHLSTKYRTHQNKSRKKINITKYILQMFSRDFCTPFFEPSLVTFPQRLNTSLPLLSILNIVVSLLLTIPACLTINKYGKFVIVKEIRSEY